MIIIGHKDGSIQKKSSVGITQKTRGLLTHTVIGGEFAVVSDEEEVAFKTLLGSCVAIMFYDKIKKIKAMNHFLLPSTSNSNDDMKYGLYSVEAMLNEMYKIGCSKSNMLAKISGGADIMKLNTNTNSIGFRNVKFAKEFCQSEGFTLISEHTRGEHGRLILLANDFETFIKVTQKSETDNKILSEEKSLQSQISKAPVIKEYTGAVDLFGYKEEVEPKMEIELFYDIGVFMYSVLVIDDSASMRRIIKDMIDGMDEFYVVDMAVDAYDAREKIKEYEPDLVTIDINMPKMDGVTFLRNLMRLHPMPAVVISGESVRGNDIFNDGAVGFISKPETGESMQSFQKRIEENLMNLIFLLKRYTLKKPKASKKVEIKKEQNVGYKVHPDEVIPLNPALISGRRLIAIGSSTGGVESLLKVFVKLPSNLPPIVITQHIPYGFSNSFAQRLNDNSEVKVCEAKSDMKLENGCAYLAPGNMHLTIERRGKEYYTKLLDEKKVSQHKPSVDVLFRSVNNSVGGAAMAVMMTGMGDDGTIAMKELFDNNAYTVAQNEESCVVFGMPAKAIKAGAVKDIIHLDEIAQYIVDFSKGKRR